MRRQLEQQGAQPMIGPPGPGAEQGGQGGQGGPGGIRSPAGPAGRGPQFSPEAFSQMPLGEGATPMDREMAGQYARNFNIVFGLVPNTTMDEYVRAWAWWANNTSVANLPEDVKLLATGHGGRLGG